MLACTALLALLAVLAATAQAQPYPVGTVLVEKGFVKVRHNGQEQFFQTDPRLVPVYEGDVLHTGPESKATLNMREGNEGAQLYSNSHLTVSTAKPSLSSFALNTGKALFKYLVSAKYNNRMQVQTQTATFGVKGTEFVVGTEQDKSYVVTLSGVVTVSRNDMPDEPPVEIAKDQGIVLTRDRPAPPPRQVSAAVRQRVVERDATLQDVQVLEEQPPVDTSQADIPWYHKLMPLLPFLHYLLLL